MTSQATIQERFAMNRENFILDPVTDTECFAREDVKTQVIAESLDIDLVTGLAPKRLVWGPYGGGKTHTLMRTMEELKQLTKVYSVRIECPDLSKKSRFHDLYREGIMRQLGQDFVIGLIEEAVHAVGLRRRGEMLKGLRDKFGDEELAKAAIEVIPNFDNLDLWRWISGVAMPSKDLNTLGQTQDLTQAEAARLSDYICLLGRLLRDLRGERLVLILDEMERLRSIGADTITTFVSGFTRLVDPNQRDVSVLIGASAEAQTNMVEVFSQNGPVLSRIGTDAQIEIQSLDDAGVDIFIKGVIAYVRDQGPDLELLMQAAKGGTSESVVADFFPFTIESVEALKSQLTQIMTSREITIKMTRALGRAHRSGGSIITSEHVA